MIAIVGGLGAAVGWASATLLAARSSRAIGTIATLTWVMIAGMAIAAPLAAMARPPEITRSALIWLAVAGTANLAGLGFTYAALARGRVGLVSSITSTEGALAALAAIVLGERPGPITLLGMGVVVLGVVIVASAAPANDGAAAARAPLGPTLMLAAAGAVAFGINMLASGEVSNQVPLAWVTVPARLLGVVIILAAIVGGQRVHPPGRPVLWAAAAGVAEVAGLVAFAVGARDSVAITAVMASQFAVLAAIGGRIFFHERLTRRQVMAIAITAVGVAIVAAQA